MTHPKAIVFDFFGVILTDPFLRWLTKYDYKDLTAYQISSRRVDVGLITEETFYEELSRKSGRPIDTVRADFAENGKIDKELIELIESLHHQYTIALLTNASSEYVNPILLKYDLKKHFDVIVVSAEVGFAKPSSEIFDYLLKKLTYTPEEVIFIDDSVINIEKSQSMGIRSIRFEGIDKLVKDLESYGVNSNT